MFNSWFGTFAYVCNEMQIYIYTERLKHMHFMHKSPHTESTIYCVLRICECLLKFLVNLLFVLNSNKRVSISIYAKKCSKLAE